MRLQNYISYAIQILAFKAFRAFGYPKMTPSNSVFSVTHACNSKCRSCNIWEYYIKDPKLGAKQLTTEQWLKVWKTMGPSTFCVFTGGEPFLRRDAYELLMGIQKYKKPKILTICTNGLLPERIEAVLEKFLPNMNKDMDITVNLSLDHIGKKHDEVRGVPGNWEKLMESAEVIKRLQKKYGYPNLCFHTVVSKWTVKDIDEIYDYVVKNLNPDIYIMEPGEERYELGTMNSGITPKKEDLAKVFRVYSKSGRNVTKVTNLIRKIYIDKYIKGKGLSCYAAFNHVQISPSGNVWPCCMVGDSMPLGNLRDADFDFRKVWFSKRANEIREKVKARAFSTCKDCYLAVAANTSIPQNILLTAKYALKQIFERKKEVPDKQPILSDDLNVLVNQEPEKIKEEINIKVR